MNGDQERESRRRDDDLLSRTVNVVSDHDSLIKALDLRTKLHALHLFGGWKEGDRERTKGVYEIIEQTEVTIASVRDAAASVGKKQDKLLQAVYSIGGFLSIIGVAALLWGSKVANDIVQHGVIAR